MAIIANKINPAQDKDKQAVQQPFTPTGPAFIGTGQGQPPISRPGAAATAPKFTGIQQFLSANKGAAGQLSGKIQTGVEKQIGQQKVGAEREVGDIGAQQQQINKTLQQGQGYQQQLGQEETARQLAGNQPELQQFVGLRTGQTQQQQGQQLAQEQQQAQGAVQQLGDTAQKRLGQLGSETGRTGLLQEFVGGPRKDYSGAFSKLDQALLQRDKSGAIGSARQKIQDIQRNDIGALQSRLGTEAEAANKLQEQSAGLAEQLGTQASGLEKSYIDRLQAGVGAAQAKREQEQKDLTEAFDIIQGKAQNTRQLDIPKYMEMLGLTPGMQTFGMFDDPEFNRDAYIKQSMQKAESYKDIASDEDVAKYKALANLARSGLVENQLVGPREDELALSRAGSLEKAAEVLKDESGRSKLASGLGTAAEDFLTKALGTNVAGYGRDTYDEGFGRTGVKESTASMNLGQLLKDAGFNPAMYTTPTNTIAQDAVKGATDPIKDLMSGQLPQTGADLFPWLAGGANFLGAGALQGAVGNILSGLTGGDAQGGAQAAAERNAKAALQQNLMNTLKGMGFGKVLGAQGQVEAFEPQMQYSDAQRAYKNFSESGGKQAYAQSIINEEIKRSQPVPGMPPWAQPPPPDMNAVTARANALAEQRQAQLLDAQLSAQQKLTQILGGVGAGGGFATPSLK